MVEPALTAASTSLLIPIDNVSIWGYWAFSLSKQVCNCSKDWLCSLGSSLLAGIAIKPRKVSCSHWSINSASSGICSTLQPDFASSALIFTWISTFKGARFSGRWLFKRLAIFILSTLCTQSKCAATRALLFDWRYQNWGFANYACLQISERVCLYGFSSNQKA